MRIMIIFCALLLACPTLRAQPHEHDHGDSSAAHLHFSHPLVAESVSPDTKIRLDYLRRADEHDDGTAHDQTIRLEGEYAFHPASASR